LTTIEQIRQRAEADAKTNGCFLNPDKKFVTDLFEGLKKNEERYGYASCPCRLASGVLEYDRDILCPCFYRDPDVQEYNACYCALYVSKAVVDGAVTVEPVPERRPQEKQAMAFSMSTKALTEKKSAKKPSIDAKTTTTKGMKLWYCTQCGYVCYREEPPFICPICKAKKEMFFELPQKG
jgi:ferredoxin-thioredoxin reductase catalytic subunit/rubredoxin